MNNTKLVRTKKEFEQLENYSTFFMIDPSTGLVTQCELIHWSSMRNYYIVKKQKGGIMKVMGIAKLFVSKKELGDVFGI